MSRIDRGAPSRNTKFYADVAPAETEAFSNHGRERGTWKVATEKLTPSQRRDLHGRLHDGGSTWELSDLEQEAKDAKNDSSGYRRSDDRRHKRAAGKK